jgi:hypothetical protein
MWKHRLLLLVLCLLVPTMTPAMDAVSLCATIRGTRCVYTIPGLPGLRLEEVRFQQESWGARILGTIRNTGTTPVSRIVLTVDWASYNTPFDTTSVAAIGADPLPAGSAKQVELMSTAETFKLGDVPGLGFRLSARWPGQSQPVVLVRQP